MTYFSVYNDKLIFSAQPCCQVLLHRRVGRQRERVEVVREASYRRDI